MKIFLIGFMGSGKTHCGRLLSQKLNFPFFDLDEKVEEVAGKSIVEIFTSEGAEHFRVLEKEMLANLSASHESFVMSCGGGTPCYLNNIEFMNDAGITVWINTPLEILFQRLVEEKDKRPLIKDLSDEQLKSFISKKFADRKIYYEQAGIIIDEEPVRVEKLIEKIFHA